MYERKGVRNKCTSAACAVLKELNTSVRGVIELHINFGDSCCKQHVSRRGGKTEIVGKAAEKRNSGDVRGITSHSSAETELARFRKRWCHPIYTNKKAGCRQMCGRKEKQREKEKQSKTK